MNGQCLCGKTTFEVELKNHDVHVCHCSMCRRQTSGVIMTIDVVQGSLKFIQQEHLSIFNSSEGGERGFCNVCGTTVFWRTKDQGYCNINAFSLDEPVDDLKLDLEIFIDSKPSFYAFKNNTKKMTEAEVIALFNSAES